MRLASYLFSLCPVIFPLARTALTLGVGRLAGLSLPLWLLPHFSHHFPGMVQEVRHRKWWREFKHYFSKLIEARALLCDLSGGPSLGLGHTGCHGTNMCVAHLHWTSSSPNLNNFLTNTYMDWKLVSHPKFLPQKFL